MIDNNQADTLRKMAAHLSSESARRRFKKETREKLGYVKVAEQVDQVDGVEEIYALEGRALDNALNPLKYTPDNQSACVLAP